MTAPDPAFADPRLARLYDPLEDDRADLDAYVSMTDEFGAHSVVDVGCGTGEFAVRLVAHAQRRGGSLSVIGVDPAAASIELARAKPNAEHVRWVIGTAPDLIDGARPVGDVDLVVMTANVAQVFVGDDEWLDTLRACRSMLDRAGHLVFETRDPARRAWEDWSGDALRSIDDVPDVGPVETCIEVTSVELPLVTFDAWYRFLDTGDTVRSTSTLRFRDRAEIESTLAEAGFAVDEIRDAPDRLGREFVVIARPSSPASAGV